MLFMISMLAVLVISTIVVSKIAEMLHAERYGFWWILLTTILAPIVAMIPISLIIPQFDSSRPLWLAVLFLLVAISCGAFKYINVMTWKASVTTYIASLLVSTILTITASVLNGIPAKAVFNMNIDKNTAMSLSKFNGKSEVDPEIMTALNEVDFESEYSEEIEKNEEDDEPTELDFLPPKVVKEIERKKSIVYKEPKYHVTKVSKINSLTGYNVRILQSNGNSISGTIKTINRSNIMIEQRVSNGSFISPLEIAQIKKLEVYRK